MRNCLKLIFIIFYILEKILYKFVIMPIKKSMFCKCGNNVYLGKKSEFTYKNITIGNNVSIGMYAIFMSSNAKINIGNNVMFGPKVTIVTGDHRTDVIGEYMINIHEKLPENDQDVVIKDDVWIGSNVTILKGVTIGEGSIIAAGSLINRNIEPYTIVGGIPCRKIKDRFNKDEIKIHKDMLNIR